MNPTGLTKFGARYCDPTLARWTQQDPSPAPSPPRSVNRYAYVGGEHININRSDQSGYLYGLDKDDFDDFLGLGNHNPVSACLLGGAGGGTRLFSALR